MKLYPGPGLADVDVLITTNKRVTGSMKLRSIIRQTFASDIGHGDEFLLSLRNYDGGTVYVEVGVFGDEDEVFDYTLTMLPMSRQQQMDAPERPQGLTGTVAHDAVSLTWDDPGDASITGYQILRRNRAVDAPGQFQVHVDDTGSAEASYVDTEVAPETRYVYRIKARNAAGLSERSVYFNADTPAVPDPALNNPATGVPTIIGTAQVGETLTADTSGIADADGLDNATFVYQWSIILGAASGDIPGATKATYIPTATDEGLAIKVRVSFADDAGNEETLTSAATAEVAAGGPTDPPGSPRKLTGTANSDGTVTLSWDAPNDDSVTGYQILRKRPREGEKILLVYVNNTGSTATEYTDNDVTPDVLHAYRVKAINAVGLSRQSKFINVTPMQPAEPTQNSAATGTLTISGSAQVGETLTADTSGIADADGLDSATFSYQWIANDGTLDTDIQGATGSSYTLVAADEGKTVKVRVSFTDDAGNNETLTSTATEAVSFVVQQQVENSAATGAPAITGTAQVGETLTADTSGIADSDGLDNAAFSYQWIANDGTTDTDIPGATGWTYTPVAEDEGKTIKVRVSFTDDADNGETLSSAATTRVEARPNSPATGAPAIGGTAQVGETLTVDTSGIADADGLDTAAFSHRWLADGIEITGATSSSYTVKATDLGKTLKVRVSYTDDRGAEESVTSAATGAVVAKPNSPATGAPIIGGTVQVGETLTADVSGIADADGLDTAAFSYQWLADDIEITGATSSTYTLTPDDEGKSIKVRVSFTDDGGNEESLTSGATVAVMAAEPEPEPEEPPAQPTGLSGTASHDEVSLSWDDPEDDSITGYQILRRNPAVDAPGQFQVHVDDTGSAATTLR